MSKASPPDYLCDLARKILAAHHSYAMGISLAHAYERYAKQIPDSGIGSFWISMAEQIIAADMRAKDEIFGLRKSQSDEKPINENGA